MVQCSSTFIAGFLARQKELYESCTRTAYLRAVLVQLCHTLENREHYIIVDGTRCRRSRRRSAGPRYAQSALASHYYECP